jgi:cytochrome c553
MLVDGFRDPEAAFAAVQGLQFCEPVRRVNGPPEAQGVPATRASGINQGNVAGRLHCNCAHHRDISSAASAARGRWAARRGARANAARVDCRALFCVPVTLCSKLSLDHIGDQVVLVTHDPHHFGGGGDRVGGWFGGVAPLARHHKSSQADRDRSKREKTFRHHPSSVSNGRLKLKHSFEKKARRAWGKYVTFSALRFWRHGLEGVKPPRKTATLADAPEAIIHLVEIGDPDRNIPPCGACHRHGVGGPIDAPVLSEQRQEYLTSQLKMFASGLRRNDVYGRMRAIAAKLTDREINGLAAFYRAGFR